MRKIFRLSLLVVFIIILLMDNVSANIRIGNIFVDCSKDTIIVGDNITGFIRYEADSHTIVLQDVIIIMPDTMSVISGGILIYDEDTVNIKLIGDNTITGIVPIEISHSVCCISGSGRLVLNAPYDDAWGGIFFWALYPSYENRNGLIISDGCRVEIHAPHSTGIYTRRNPNNPEETIDRCHVKVIGSTLVVDAENVFWHVADLIMENSHIVNPINGYFSADSGIIVDNMQQNCTYLEICPGTSNIPMYDTSHYKVFGSRNGICLQDISENANVRIFSISGQLIQSMKITQNNTFIPVRSGVYIVCIGNVKRKVIVI